MGKVLVTGAAGYIGRHVVTALLDLGENVVDCDFSPEGIDPRAEFLNVPIFSGAADIYEQTGRPDVCIHMAWRNGFVHNASTHMGDLSNHIMFCENMMKGGLPKLAVMGTMHEVGYWEGAIDENTPCRPQSQYGVAKNALRQSLLLSSKQLGCSLRWLRAFYITGDDRKGNSIFSKITRAVEEGKKEFPFTSGKNMYDFLDINTLAQMIAKASIQSEIDGVINVCSGKPVSLAERVELFLQEHQYDIKLQYGAFPDRPYDSPGVWGNSEKIDYIMDHF